MDVRILGAEDLPEFERFLAAHRDSSMFLRGNARKAGLVFAELRHQSTHVGGWDGERLRGVVGHAWNGILLLQAPDDVEVLARACVAASGRPVTGLSGPPEQVRRARAELGLADAATSLDADEGLHALDLDAVVSPAALVEGRVVCRPPRPEERETLRAWRHAYNVEVVGVADTEEERRRSANGIEAQIDEGVVWVAEAGGELLSLSTFNATLPDIVQLGGIYTPPRLRGQGHARVAVAGSLLAARERGATRAVLFTANPSAERCYHAVGFRRTGEYGLVVFR